MCRPIWKWGFVSAVVLTFSVAVVSAQERPADPPLPPAAPAPQVEPAAPPAVPGQTRVYGPVEINRGPGGKRINIFIPPIGRFGGFSADIGGGRVGIDVGPSGGSPVDPGFSGLHLEIFHPRSFSGPPVVYGPAFHPSLGVGVVTNPYLGCVDGNCDPRTTLPAYADPATAPSADSVLPPMLDEGRPAAPAIPPEPSLPAETVVPQRPANAPPAGAERGPQFPSQFAPQSSRPVAPRFFPSTGPAFLPPGFIPRNGFDVDNGVRPNPATRPGDDPFGPQRPREPGEPAT